MRLRHAVLVGLMGVGAVSAPDFAVAADEPSSKPSAIPAAAAGAARVAAFDPARHMRVGEVKPGMTGYGLSVFSGTKIERFEVEVISVLKNFNPKYDVILIKCRGQNLEHTGAVAGMSGSPIFLKDDAGKERMIGAFAYGWSMSKDPIAGVQPIEYMLSIPLGTAPPGVAGAGKPIAGAQQNATPRGTWSMQDAVKQWEKFSNPATAGSVPLDSSNGPVAKTQSPAGQLEQLATPLMTSGASSKLIKQFGPLFEAHGLTLLQAGGSGKAPAGMPTPKMEPGSVMAVPMLIGDTDMTAVGTTTEVLDGKVYGFGHPFNNEGAVTLPMGPGSINHIVATLTTSFKLGTIVGPAGTITADRSVGIAGEMGKSPQLAPIDLRVTYDDGSADERYHFESIVHPRFSPLLSGMAVMSALSGTNDLPQYNTLDYDVELSFSNGKTIKLSDTIANGSDREMFRAIGMPLLTASDNPFERVLVNKVSGTVRVSRDVKLAQIVEVNLPRAKYAPGETLKAFVEFKRFRGGEDIVPVELELPKDLKEGNYQLIISDWTRYMQDEQVSKPFRFTGESINELFDALKDFTSVRQNAIYLRLVRQADGIAIGRTALPKLPSSRRQMLLGAGRSGTTRFISSVTRSVPMDTVMQGSADFVINIDDDVKTEPGEAGPPAPVDASPSAPAPAAPTPMPPTKLPDPNPAPMPMPMPMPNE